MLMIGGHDVANWQCGRDQVLEDDAVQERRCEPARQWNGRVSEEGDEEIWRGLNLGFGEEER
jgi:hypothetical protein